MAELTIEEGIRDMISDGEKSLEIYWIEDINKGDEHWWIDVCEDSLGRVCEMNWIWDIISKAETEIDNDPESDYGCLESDIIVDDLFSEAVVKSAVEKWLKDRELKIDIEIISPEGTVAEKRVLDAVERAREEFPELVL